MGKGILRITKNPELWKICLYAQCYGGMSVDWDSGKRLVQFHSRSYSSARRNYGNHPPRFFFFNWYWSQTLHVQYSGRNVSLPFLRCVPFFAIVILRHFVCSLFGFFAAIPFPFSGILFNSLSHTFVEHSICLFLGKTGHINRMGRTMYRMFRTVCRNTCHAHA